MKIVCVILINLISLFPSEYKLGGKAEICIEPLQKEESLR